MPFCLDTTIPDARPSRLPAKAPRCYEEDLLPRVDGWVQRSAAGDGHTRYVAADLSAAQLTDIYSQWERGIASLATLGRPHGLSVASISQLLRIRGYDMGETISRRAAKRRLANGVEARRIRLRRSRK